MSPAEEDRLRQRAVLRSRINKIAYDAEGIALDRFLSFPTLEDWDTDPGVQFIRGYAFELRRAIQACRFDPVCSRSFAQGRTAARHDLRNLGAI
jgi:hypothetical protein